jgi:hypothetical protein
MKPITLKHDHFRLVFTRNPDTYLGKRLLIISPYINTCLLASSSVKGFTSSLVAKLKTSPNAMDMGSAGRARLNIISSSNVKHNP